MYQTKHGTREGLADRLENWASRLGQDRSLPWVGLGLIADIETAVAVLNNAPEQAKAIINQEEFDL